ncbi:virion structural protein [Bacillus phage vB_BpuM-BpSp]|nr:virion structural protein [Bacillus phage vB_BpuM-BpSp]
MAYDLNSFYSTTLSSNSLSKSIIDQLSSNSRFSSLSKIIVSPGSYNTSPIGYDETGNPVYDSGVGVTMNAELKDAIDKKHTRNNDTMLRGNGSNVIENTSTGNILTLVSKGKVKAMIDENGRFTGSIRLENIEDLNTLTLDTTRFYTKSQVDSILTAKVSKSDIFNDDKAIKVELMDKEVVLHRDYDIHDMDDVRHIVAAERTAWNKKYDKPSLGIPKTDIAKEFTDRVDASALDTDLKVHTENGDIHTSTSERAKWNKKYDKPATGIPFTHFSEGVQNTINSMAKADDLKKHDENEVRHITDTEREKWNAKYLKPEGGVPFNHLEKYVQDEISEAAKDEELQSHKEDEVRHITGTERTAWSSKYEKPVNGIPEGDLTSSVQSKLNTAATKNELKEHATDATIHITADERTAWNVHKADGKIHVQDGERTKWNAKYDKPANGIPEDDLSAGLQTKLNSKVSNTDFNTHATDSVKHVTQSERDSWNSRYQKATNGIPEEDLHKDVTAKINSAAKAADLSAHIADKVAHTTETEKAKWGAKYDKPKDGIPEEDLTVAFRAKVDSKASTNALTTHSNDTVKHVTAEERASWVAKYDKPEKGIPAIDLEASLKTKIETSAKASDLTSHANDTVIHITAEERDTWNGAYTKPSTGIPETDIEQNFRSKVNGMVSTTDFNAHATDTVKHVTQSERDGWNAKYVKPSTGIPQADLSTTLKTKIDSFATITNLDAHKNDQVAHVTESDRTKWDGKYSKPSKGIPASDLTTELSGTIDSLSEHVSDEAIHLSTADRTKLEQAYTKPSKGIPASDLSTEVTSRLVQDKYTLKVEEATKKVEIASEAHQLTHEFGFEFFVAAFKSEQLDVTPEPAEGETIPEEDKVFQTVWTQVIPSSVQINDDTKVVTVSFAEDFVGQIVVR